MLAFKTALYVVTCASAFFFAYWEMKLKRRLTDDLLDRQAENVSDFDAFYGVRKELMRERLIKGLPREARSRLRIVIGFKLLFLAALVAEVICLQR